MLLLCGGKVVTGMTTGTTLCRRRAVVLLVALFVILTTASSAVAEGAPVIAAAGDIACAPGSARTVTKCHQNETAALLGSGYAAILPLGDVQYPCGRLSDFNGSYASSWGRFRSKSYPVVGDNEYGRSTCSSPGAEGYFTYFGGRASPDDPACTASCKGYYSYDIGGWHIVAVNSECSESGVGGCSATSAQGKWLKADLAAHPARCTLAYWHRPYWASDGTTKPEFGYFVNTLHVAGAEVVLAGHNHVYQRWHPQTPVGVVDEAKGIRQFIVGTGGASHSNTPAKPANVAVQDKTTFGVLELTLGTGSYSWNFKKDGASGSFTDSGTTSCH